jgi:hypothetical protein
MSGNDASGNSEAVRQLRASPAPHSSRLFIESTECARGRLDVQHINIMLNSK